MRRKKTEKQLLHGNDGESAELKRVKNMDGGGRGSVGADGLRLDLYLALYVRTSMQKKVGRRLWK